ncbi:MAG TPA: hypothetical protein VFQ68_14585 [Streptosporangiaceae bacterium]|nr:hypothetical protein [Streptosporangiaceae bacterium]
MTASGTPGPAMSRTSAHLMRSQMIITARRGCRSASQASVTPPMNIGITLTTKVTAASSADRVRSKTSTVSATRAN